MDEEDNHSARVFSVSSFVLGLFLIVPLLNILIFCPLAIFLGSVALKKMIKRKSDFHWKHFALASSGIILGILPYVFMGLKILMNLKIIR